jgi:hypothetical protein
MAKTSKKSAITPLQIMQLKLYVRLSLIAVIIFLLFVLLIVSRIAPEFDTYISHALITMACILPIAFVGLFSSLVVKANNSMAAKTFLNSLGIICGVSAGAILIYVLMISVFAPIGDLGNSLIAGALILLLTPGLVIWFARDRKI